MTYHLGIDLGTTYVGAALVRDGRAEVITLGDRSAVVPSVLFFKDDGEVLTGSAAIRRGLSDPTRVVREFKRRVGDTTPVMVGPTPYSPDALMSELLRQVLEAATEREGSAPAGIGITHPANWGPYKVDVLNQAIRMAEASDATTLTEPEAAAIHYAFTERLEPGGVVAVYDLGGGTFDAAVLRKTDDERQFEVLGEAEGIERLGGIDFDEAVFQHVLRLAGSALRDLDPDEPATIQAVARIRQECAAAKEALSSDTDVAIPVMLANLQTEVRLTRSEFEAMIRPAITQTIEAMRRAVRSAGVAPDDLTAVLLVGGSSRIPLIAQMVGAELGRPIAVDVHPKHTVALGAAVAAAAADGVVGAAGPEPVTEPRVAVAAIAGDPDEAPDSAPVVEIDPPKREPTTAGTPVRSTVDLPAAATAVLTEPPPNAQPNPAPTAPSTGHREAKPRPKWLIPAGVAAVTVALVGAVAMARAGAGQEDEEPVALDNSIATTVADLGTDETPDQTPPTTGQDVELTPPTDAPQASITTEGTAATEPTIATTAATTTTTTEAVVEGLDVTIDSIAVVDGAYSVAYSTNFDPLISSDPATNHIHFFFNTVSVSEAGSPGAGPWILYDSPAPFTGYAVADRPAAATQMCATAATSGHAVVDPARFSCFDLPDESASAGSRLLVAASATEARTPFFCKLGV